MRSGRQNQLTTWLQCGEPALQLPLRSSFLATIQESLAAGGWILSAGRLGITGSHGGGEHIRLPHRLEPGRKLCSMLVRASIFKSW